VYARIDLHYLYEAGLPAGLGQFKAAPASCGGVGADGIGGDIGGVAEAVGDIGGDGIGGQTDCNFGRKAQNDEPREYDDRAMSHRASL